VRSVILIVAALIAGCISTSEVVPAGKDSYMVVGTAQGGMNAGKGQIEAVKAANAYCAQSSKLMVIRRTDSGGNAGFGGEHDTLIFSCVAENDPEYQRPNLHADPTTVIEDQRTPPPKQ
jgi:hypothetical protein